ncbi:hypothetical protein [Desulfosarcina sp.]|uniref:hypothetical protein n=1 Tax=Desulfosarcina sp. TaxID=2027861 RepID=UPI0035615BBA
MNTHRDRKRVKKPRIELTDQDLEHLAGIRAPLSVPALARRAGLPYMQVYNIVHGRVKSISDRHYRLLFGQAPPPRKPKRVDGAAFRAMVDLWLFLNDDLTRSDLSREFEEGAPPKKADLRIFSGQVRTVPPRLERLMRKKFSDAGVDGHQLDRWLDELDTLPSVGRIPYRRIRPILRFIRDELGVHPTAMLHQSVERYESGMLKSVSRDTFNRAMTLKHRTEKAIALGKNREIEKLREDVCGGKSGYSLYLEVEEELTFLCRYAQKSAKSYLGRSMWTYQTGKARRIADWRAQKILQDCDRFIRETPALSLACLPRSQRAMRVRMLLDVLVARTTQLLSEQEGLVFEKKILRPSHARGEYTNQKHGFTRFDMAPGILGMKKKAFDLMVAKNCEIFRSVGRYTKRWYLSDLYLKELSEKEFFDLISKKYERMAISLNRSMGVDACLH